MLFGVCSSDEKYKLTRQLGSHSGAAVVGAGVAPGGSGVSGAIVVVVVKAGTAVEVLFVWVVAAVVSGPSVPV